jgi:hypothetical protein
MAIANSPLFSVTRGGLREAMSPVAKIGLVRHRIDGINRTNPRRRERFAAGGSGFDFLWRVPCTYLFRGIEVLAPGLRTTSCLGRFMSCLRPQFGRSHTGRSRTAGLLGRLARRGWSASR